MKTNVLGALLMGTLACGAAEIVSFKDAGKIKSWDAWNDHRQKVVVTNILKREHHCVPWQRLNALDWGLPEVGRLPTRTSEQVKSSPFSVGCETMDRDYAAWDNFKALVPMLGVKRARFFSGWAKTEQEKGKYDFTWLDPHLRECAAMHVKPWVCVSYGNPLYGSDFRLGMRVQQVTSNPEGFAAWLRYVKALVTRYKDVVDEWEIWNEPFWQGAEYAELFLRTGRVIREVQPQAKLFCTAIGWGRDPAKSDYAILLERLKKENALDLCSYFIYHPYAPNPDMVYDRWLALRAFVKTYSPKFDILQGETGCPSQLEFGHALARIEWTEYQQAKWDLRQALGDFSRGIPSSVFAMIDYQYTFMLQSFGLVRSNTLKEFIYRRPSWYAMRNVYALFDDETVCEKNFVLNGHPIVRRADPRAKGARRLACQCYRRNGARLRAYWFCEARPSEKLEFDAVDLMIPEVLKEPCLVDLITGRVFAFPADRVQAQEPDRIVLKGVPMWDSPVLIAARDAIRPVPKASAR